MPPIVLLLIYSVSSTITPGPNNLMLMHSGLTFGTRRTIPHLLGVACGFAILAMTIATGFGAVFAKYPLLKTVIKILGSGYMLYLAWRIAFVSSSKKRSTVDVNKPLTFFQAAAFQWVNPKAWVMTIGAVSIFHLSNNYLTNALILSSVGLWVFIPCGLLWITFGTMLQRILTTERHLKYFNYAMGLLLASSIVLMLID